MVGFKGGKCGFWQLLGVGGSEGFSEEGEKIQGPQPFALLFRFRGRDFF